MDYKKILPEEYGVLINKLPTSFSSQCFISSFLAGLSIHYFPYLDENGNREKGFLSIYADKTQQAEEKAFFAVMKKITELSSDYLTFIGVPKEIIKEREKDSPYGHEKFTYEEYKSIIPCPLPLDWVQIAEYAVQVKEKYKDVDLELEK